MLMVLGIERPLDVSLPVNNPRTAARRRRRAVDPFDKGEFFSGSGSARTWEVKMQRRLHVYRHARSFDGKQLRQNTGIANPGS